VIQSALQTYPYQALQAYLLGFKHPTTGKHIRIAIKLSKEINGLIDSLEEL
jgi:23S rRNA-/tRNA-specific pseudouridylate synthase